MNEAGLIRAALDGDLDSFNRLVLAYQDLLYNQAYRMMGEKGAAEDATQDAFIAAFRKLRTYRGGSFKAWLLRIVTNACYDELRRRKRRPATSLAPYDQDGEEIESPGWIADPGESPEEAAVRSDMRAALHHCLEELSPDFRALVILIDIQGLDYSEASQAIGKPLGTVKSRLARARVRMRDCLQQFWELLPTSYRLEREKQP